MNPAPAKQYDLESRTLAFAGLTRDFIASIPKTLINVDDCKQLLRSSGSVGSNYREANNAVSKADFVFRIKICRKEAKESEYWFELLRVPKGTDFDRERLRLLQEARELRLIFAAILHKCTKKVSNN